MSEKLKQNIAAYVEKMPELLKDHRGEVVLMKDGAVVSFHKSQESAFAAGYKQFGHSGFFVQEIVELQHAAVCLP